MSDLRFGPQRPPLGAADLVHPSASNQAGAVSTVVVHTRYEPTLL